MSMSQMAEMEISNLKDLDDEPHAWGQKAEQMKNADNYIGTDAETPLMPEIAKDLPAEAAPDAMSIFH
jgi:hypothetical protein